MHGRKWNAIHYYRILFFNEYYVKFSSCTLFFFNRMKFPSKRLFCVIFSLTFESPHNISLQLCFLFRRILRSLVITGNLSPSCFYIATVVYAMCCKWVLLRNTCEWCNLNPCTKRTNEERTYRNAIVCLVKFKQRIYTHTLALAHRKMCEWNSTIETSRSIHHM